MNAMFSWRRTRKTSNRKEHGRISTTVEAGRTGATVINLLYTPTTMNRWLPVVGGVCMNLALGSLYAWSVFVLPLEQEFGWTRAQTSWTFTIAIVTFAASFVVAGRIQDLRGPRICATIGGTLVGLGFVLSSFTTSLAYLYAIFGVVVGLGNGFGYATPVPVASKWFPDKRGLVVGLMVGGYGAGSAIIGPVATSLIGSVGWRPTFQILGVLFFGMGMIGAWLLKNPPAGYQPPGWTPARSGAAGQRSARDYSPSEMLKTGTFYALWVAYCLGATAGLMIISQLVPFARGGGLERRRGNVRDHHRRRRQRRRTDPVRVVVGQTRAVDDPPRDGVVVRGRHAHLVCPARRSAPLLYSRGCRLLVLRDAALGLCVDDRRFLRDAQPRDELRSAVQRVGRRRCDRADDRSAGIRHHR